MSEDRGERRPRPRGGRRPRRKVCTFCVDKIEFIDYKDVNRLRRFTNERGKILPRRMSERGHQARTCHRADALHGGLSSMENSSEQSELFLFAGSAAVFPERALKPRNSLKKMIRPGYRNRRRRRRSALRPCAF